MKYRLVAFIVSLLFFASCSAPRNLAYFDNLREETVVTEKIANEAEAKIQPGDLLSINVTSLSPESNILFNKGALPTASNANVNGVTYVQETEGYLVDKSGFVVLPILGKVKLENFTREEAETQLTASLQKYLKEPVVNVRFRNFKVTVIGEVNRPSTFQVADGNVNILEALGMAGDMTAFGKRENVLVIRETKDERSMVRLNLNDKNILKSPFFNLQQNDIVYVEPDKAKEVQASANPRNISIIVGAMSVLTIILSRLL
ncbi:polysaccharide biosynthesis/export family protein [Pontibacter cellulosilyticus]|uniref:Polysaccharide biosynthesis/export family protein n=1 Tax=Pontibacter cellulosilyticus TaxID=1720253 RepID=A0A923N9G8_9BACT|nr:polysaccharide biosynthesis/export family protein [Pontibacter cellulosilyticus]MBC5993347.1 polysaccharide biosynthesis/export family protein [Pontibacter cellulosilyticus]